MDPAEGKENELDYKGAFSKGILCYTSWTQTTLIHSYDLELKYMY